MRTTLLRITAFVVLVTLVPAVASAQACLTRCVQGAAAPLGTSAADAGADRPVATHADPHLHADVPRLVHQHHAGTCLFAVSPFLVDPGTAGPAPGDGQRWAPFDPLRLASFIPLPPEHRPRRV